VSEPESADPEVGIRALLAAGDHAGAVTAAIRGYGPRLLSYLDRVLRSPPDADDVFAVCCEDMWKGVAGFRGESSFLTWSYRLAWHAAARFLRDPYRKRGRVLETTEAGRLAAEVALTTAPHLRQNAKDALEEIRATLAPEEQTLLVLRIDRDLSWTEIAQVLAEDGAEPPSEPALRKRFERLKDRLRLAVEARGLV
jgi:RNA polymerase sigma-70 factor (ECF subfamily)